MIIHIISSIDWFKIIIIKVIHHNLLLFLFSNPVMSSSLQPHGLQHARPSCPSPSPKVCQSSCPFHRWCHLAILSSDVLFSFCTQSFPASGTFPISWLVSDDQNTVTSALASVLPTSIQVWFPLRLTGLIFLLFKGLSRVFFSTTVWMHQFFSTPPCLRSSSHICTWLLERPWPWLYRPLSAKWCLFFLTHCLGLYIYNIVYYVIYNIYYIWVRHDSNWTTIKYIIYRHIYVIEIYRWKRKSFCSRLEEAVE